MIYICDKCKFLFERASEPERCPDCGKQVIREANADETAEFVALCKEFRKNSGKGSANETSNT
jgi:predicted RNA-binding Zn-ribbon protein involved in translation (DUF1610 family)